MSTPEEPPTTDVMNPFAHAPRNGPLTVGERCGLAVVFAMLAIGMTHALIRAERADNPSTAAGGRVDAAVRLGQRADADSPPR